MRTNDDASKRRPKIKRNIASFNIFHSRPFAKTFFLFDAFLFLSAASTNSDKAQEKTPRFPYPRPPFHLTSTPFQTFKRAVAPIVRRPHYRQFNQKNKKSAKKPKENGKTTRRPKKIALSRKNKRGADFLSKPTPRFPFASTVSVQRPPPAVI